MKLAVTLAVLTTLGAAVPAEARRPPPVGMAQARRTALRLHPGRIVKQELEREKGGSGLRYSFDIRSGGVVHEVGVDARTRRVLENSRS